MDNYQMASLDVQNVNYISFGPSFNDIVSQHQQQQQQNDHFSFESCFQLNIEEEKSDFEKVKAELNDINISNNGNVSHGEETFEKSVLGSIVQTDIVNREETQQASPDFGCFVPNPVNHNVNLTSHEVGSGNNNSRELLMEPPKIQKRVNYLNHKFVISETEDISLDKLLAINPANDNLETNFLEIKSQLQRISPPNVKPVTAARPLPRQGESILKVPATINAAEVQCKKVFFVDDNKMKQVLSSKISSGIFRSTANVAKKRKLSETEVCAGGGGGSLNGSQSTAPSNILLSKSAHGKIVPKSSHIEELSAKSTKVEADKSTAGSNSTIGGAVPLSNGSYNRQFIKIPLSALPVLDKANGKNGLSNIGDNLKAKLSSNNLVLNIVNMVANNPEITQKTEIDHSQFTGDKTAVPNSVQNNAISGDAGKMAILDDRKSMVYHNRQTNTKIIYRIINPEDVNLRKEDSIHVDKTIKIKKSNFVHRNRPGRPKGVQRKRIVTTNPEQSVVLTQPTARTRAGRLSRPPRHVQNYFKVNGKFSDTQIPNDENPSEKLNADNEENIRINHPSEIQVVKKERKIPSQYKCKNCNKIYLGYSRMARHLESFPDHGDISELFQMKVKNSQTYDDSLFQYLIKKIRKTPRENRARIFFDEIANFTRRIQMLMPKLVTENAECPIEYVDQEKMKILNIPTGKYFIDMEVLNDDINLEIPPVLEPEQPVVATADPDEIDLDALTSENHYHEMHQHQQQHLSTQNINDHHQQQHHHHLHQNSHIHADTQQQHHQTIEYNLNISLDSNDADKVNLSDDSFLQSVDEFVKERWKNIAEEELHNTVSASVAVPNFVSSVNDTQLKESHLHHHHVHHHHNHHAPPILDLSLEYLLN